MFTQLLSTMFILAITALHGVLANPTGCHDFPVSLHEFSADFQEPIPPIIKAEFTTSFIQHKWFVFNQLLIHTNLPTPGMSTFHTLHQDLSPLIPNSRKSALTKHSGEHSHPPSSTTRTFRPLGRLITHSHRPPLQPSATLPRSVGTWRPTSRFGRRIRSSLGERCLLAWWPGL